MAYFIFPEHDQGIILLTKMLKFMLSRKYWLAALKSPQSSLVIGCLLVLSQALSVITRVY